MAPILESLHHKPPISPWPEDRGTDEDTSSGSRRKLVHDEETHKKLMKHVVLKQRIKHRERQHPRFALFVLILAIILLLSYFVSVFAIGLLKKLNFCSKICDELLADDTTWRHASRSNDDDSFHSINSQLLRYKALTHTFGEFFKLSDEAIRKAINDEFLWNSAKYILEMDPDDLELLGAEHAQDTETTFDNSLTINVRSKIIDNTEQEIDVDVSEPIAGEKVYATDEGKQEVTVSKVDMWLLKEIFKNLTGESVNMYLLKRFATFSEDGNLNLWKYFSTGVLDNDLSNLKRSNTHHKTNTDLESVRLSSDHKFLLYDHLADGANFLNISHASKLTVSTQCSVDRLHSLVESYNNWDGPISLAIFLHGPMEFFVFQSYLSFMTRCYENLFNRTRFNIATPAGSPIPKDVFIQTRDFDELHCSAKSNLINEILKSKLTQSREWLKSKWYPQNMMRNFARFNIHTAYQITLDIDILPCPQMSEGLELFLNKSQVYRNALVIPTYEVSEKVDFPKNKHELVALIKKGKAQPFHKDIYLPNQSATNFSIWEKLYDSFEPVHVVHRVHQFPVHYEPFSVELNSNPMYDEGFVGYGFTRSSHAYEVFKRNGDFLVLSPMFTVQLGILKVKEWSEERQRQNEYNRQRFDQFLKILDQEIASNETSKTES